MRIHLFTFAGMIACSFVNTASALDGFSDSSWDRSSAMATVRAVDINVAVNAISEPAALADASVAVI